MNSLDFHNVEGSAEIYVGETGACVVWIVEKWQGNENLCDCVKQDLKEIGCDKDWIEAVGFDTKNHGRFVIQFKALAKEDDEPEYELVSFESFDAYQDESVKRIKQLEDALRNVLAITTDSTGVAEYGLNDEVVAWDEFEEIEVAQSLLEANVGKIEYPEAE